MGGRSFGIDEFRQVIHSRLYKLHPLRYELVDIPFKFHHPMWRENCQVDLGYHVRPWTLPAPGGRRELDDAIGEIASTPLDRSRPLWEMYFVDGLANGRIAVVNKIHHALADGVAAANLLALGMDLHQRTGDRPRVLRHRPRTDPGDSWCARRSATMCARSARCPRRSATPRRASTGCGTVHASSHRN